MRLSSSSVLVFYEVTAFVSVHIIITFVLVSIIRSTALYKRTAGTVTISKHR